MRKRFNQILAVAVMAAILASGCWAIAYAATTGISDSSYNIVENGKSEYVLLLPDDGDAELNMAASEFSTMMEMSSGVKIGTVTDENLSGRTEKVISLGNTSLFSQTGIHNISFLSLPEPNSLRRTCISSVPSRDKLSSPSFFLLYDYIVFHQEAPVLSETPPEK